MAINIINLKGSNTWHPKRDKMLAIVTLIHAAKEY